MGRCASMVVALSVVAAAIGCGKSFQEADAIYKDEVAKLEALEDEVSREARNAFKSAHDNYLAEHKHEFGTISKESQALNAAAEAMRMADEKWKSARRIARGKAWLASEALEKKAKSVNWGSEEQKKYEAEEKVASSAYLSAEKDVQDALGKLKNTVQESERAGAAMKSAMEEAEREATDAGNAAEKNARRLRFPEIAAQRKAVEEARKNKDAAK